MAEYTYELKTPIQYAHQGEKIDATFVTMTAPTYKQMSHATPIKQAFVSAITEIGNTVESNDDEADTGGDVADITGSQVMQMMHSWKGDLTKIMIHAEQLFRSGAILLNGEKVPTAPLIGDLSLADVEGLLGTYVVNFFVPSLKDGQ